MDYLKTVVPSQLIGERGSNLVVINPGSANVRIGLAHHVAPLNIPHCIARLAKGSRENVGLTVKDELLNCQVTPAQHSERERAYDIIASLLKVPMLYEEVANNSSSQKTGRVDGYNPQPSNRIDTTFTWTNVEEQHFGTFLNAGKEAVGESAHQHGSADSSEYVHHKFKEFICGEAALKIPPTEPYYVCRPIRRGHFNISQHYSAEQVIDDLYAIWDWILSNKLKIFPPVRNLYSVVLVLPESFDTREIKEMLTMVLRDLRFSSAVVHQESLAAAFGNGLSTACVVNLGAQATSIVCIEDGVALPSTTMTLPFGGDDISRCLLWIQECHQTWPKISTDPIKRPIDLLMLNKIKEAYCQIREGEYDAVALVHSFEDGVTVGAHKLRLSALNVSPMGLFYPLLLVPEVYPSPPRSWFYDHEDMLDDTYHMEFSRRTESSDNMLFGNSTGLAMWDGYPFYPRMKREDKVSLADAITSSILSAGRIDLQRKLFCSIQLVGGVALTSGLVAAVEERVLHSIPSNEAIDTVEVLQSRSDPTFVPWKGGAILGILDFGRETWIHREDWIQNGIHVGSGRKYKDSYYLQALAMSYISS